MGPPRRVIDLVCLVPDQESFLEAIALWDDGHFFPILIDETELTLRFIRAFRPARIVRYPGHPHPIEIERLWDAAVDAVGRSWTRASDEASGNASDLLDGSAFPLRLGATPPGMVFSSPTSPSLAGAVALAAGRFQPIVRWEADGEPSNRLTRVQALALARSLERLVASRTRRYALIGDDCDFLTLAGPYPYRYDDREGPAAFDDLIGRNEPESVDAQTHAGPPRWAYAGRLIGDPAPSVYRAMCSLFLQPDSALLFNTYETPGLPWSDYAMNPAARVLLQRARLPVKLREGGEASLSAWSRLFQPVNKFGLVEINTQGDPSVFQLPGGPGHPCDIPPSVPSVVSIIHSFSATDPDDPATIAGRWLANGAFLYYGAMHEPFLQAFRAPTFSASCLPRVSRSSRRPAATVPIHSACPGGWFTWATPCTDTWGRGAHHPDKNPAHR